ncbi:MAG: D-alanine--D-alanine ligase [Myxococcota bacterium]|jgi:D-alanine-D-alanine ligase|nr:D-alanine--D-alanine ligase [Myxococcota bacterium]
MKDQRIGVLMGGMSTERSISLKSGTAVAAALRSRNYQVEEIDVGPDLPRRLVEAEVQVAWIALHGAFGEDGCVQGLLEIMRIPYTGSSVRGSAIAMDKISTKRMLEGLGLNLPSDTVWNRGDPAPDIPCPAVAKLPLGGSSIGVKVCQTAKDLDSALEEFGSQGEVLVEAFVAGEEITVSVIDGSARPVVAIRPQGQGHFDYTAKYIKGRTEYLVPAPISPETTTTAQRHAELAYARLGLHGLARIDFIVDIAGAPWFLEANTIPGMTATSLSPMAAGAAGLSFEDLVEHILLSARLHLDVHSGEP